MVVVTRSDESVLPWETGVLFSDLVYDSLVIRKLSFCRSEMELPFPL